ncbi:hypothetical protein [Parasediminibacterium sp. JCM 36343]|uniref:hypothetical protein n=1 Tax=Parasediminibacterium sp. JCM 36343 TaxID=3374279 RepID=UPI00397A1397
MKKVLTIVAAAFVVMAFTLKDNDYKNPNLPVDERVRLLLKQMTLEEKIAQFYTPSAEMELGDGKSFTVGWA